MSVNDQLDKLQRSLLDFFFPRRCPFCGRVVGKALLCETCEKELPYSREVRTGTFGRCAAPLYYEGAVREAILACLVDSCALGQAALETIRPYTVQTMAADHITHLTEFSHKD